MPIIKHAYCHCRVKPGDLLEKLPGLGAKPLSEYILIGMDKTDPSGLSFDVLRRWDKIGALYNDSTDQFLNQSVRQEKRFEFGYDATHGIMAMPSTRAAKNLEQILGEIGLGATPLYLVGIDLLDWARRLDEDFNYLQLMNITVAYLPDEDFIGKYDAKSLDNRVKLQYLEDHADNLRSIKVGWFEDGMKYTAQVSDNGKLECGCKDMDALIFHYDQMYRRMLLSANKPPIPEVNLLDQEPQHED